MRARLLNAVLDGGINLIDTSPRLRPQRGAHRRATSATAGTSSSWPPSAAARSRSPPDAAPPYPHDYSPANVRADVEQSPAPPAHRPPRPGPGPHVPEPRRRSRQNGTVETLRALQAEGKVRFIGMSGILPNLPDHIAMGVFDVFQIPYSAVQRDHEDLITEAADAGAGTFIRGGAARGAAVGGEELAGRAVDPGARRRPAELGDLRPRRPAERGGMSRHGVHPALHAQPSRPVHHDRRHGEPDPPRPATSPPRSRARSPPTSTRRPGSASRSRMPVKV